MYIYLLHLRRMDTCPIQFSLYQISQQPVNKFRNHCVIRYGIIIWPATEMKRVKIDLLQCVVSAETVIYRARRMLTN